MYTNTDEDNWFAISCLVFSLCICIHWIFTISIKPWYSDCKLLLSLYTRLKLLSLKIQQTLQPSYTLDKPCAFQTLRCRFVCSHVYMCEYFENICSTFNSFYKQRRRSTKCVCQGCKPFSRVVLSHAYSLYMCSCVRVCLSLSLHSLKHVYLIYACIRSTRCANTLRSEIAKRVFHR